MARLNTLLLHPDPLVRQDLRRHLSGVDFLKILGEAVSAFEALEMLDAIPYGVLFLGVELSEDVSGIELVQMLSGRRNKPALVFLATDESMAFTAFELGATDYLLLPASRERVDRTLDRLRQFKSHFKVIEPPQESWEGETVREEEAEEETLQVPLGEEEQDNFLQALRQAWDFTRRFGPVDIEKLAITLDGRTILVPYNQIVFIEAYEDYSYVHTHSQKFLTSYRLKSLEDRLRPHRFFRVHRKYLVNLDMVTEIGSLPGSNFMLRTTGRTRIELPISRRRINELKQILGL